MYRLSAEHYDILFGSKPYEREAYLLRERLWRLDPSLHTVLDVACGTGAHDEHLGRHYEVDGLDLHPEFLDVARRRNPGGRYHVADMRDFRLDRLYDVVLCLFSSIGYTRTHADLVRALACFREHLTTRGVVLVEPWLTPEAWRSPSVHDDRGTRDGVRVLRMAHSTLRRIGRDAVSVLDFHYLVGTDERVDYLRETHELGLFTRRQMEAAFREAGYGHVEYGADDGLSGRGLYVARAAPATTGEEIP